MQTINFYLESYHPKPLSFDNRFALLTLFISLIGLSIISWIQTSEVATLKLEQAKKTIQLNKQQELLTTISRQLRTKSTSEKLKYELLIKQKELNNYQKIISAVNLPTSFTLFSFSKILTDLSIQTVNQLWLTNIDIQAESLSLKGATTNASAIPTYVDKLKEANSLKRYFDELNIERHETNQALILFELLNGKLINE